jgi:hypothetical protein
MGNFITYTLHQIYTDEVYGKRWVGNVASMGRLDIGFCWKSHKESTTRKP